MSNEDNIKWNQDEIKGADRQGAILAHEIGHHSIGQEFIHPYREGYVDAKTGEVGGVLSPEATESMFERLDIPFHR